METAHVERIQEATDLGMASGSLAVMEAVEITGADPACGRKDDTGPCLAACQQQGWCVLGGFS